jgi:S-formylglutathione hydrolase FrmB
MQSDLLSQFWGQPVAIDAYVLLPDSYYKEPERRYPVMYWIQGFGGTGSINDRDEAQFQGAMRRLHQEFIIVLLDGMFNGGHQEFADSANNGPWGAALTTEFIPLTEAHFRAIGTAQTRFVGGHSSGGWSALWLQVTYPDFFAGEWSLSPDPVDFRDFIGPDLTKSPPQNFYTDAAGHDYTLDGQPLRDFVVRTGWQKQQYESFDAVFSPRGADGQPAPLFNRRTGAIDPAVERYWETHYDIARILRDRWTALSPKLRGKIHIIVGTADQFDLERPVELLAAEFRALNSDAEIDFVPGANHFTIFDYKGNVMQYIFGEASAMLP